MSKEVTKKETNLPSTAMTASDTSEVLSGDVLIPKVLLMQGLSEYVIERKAQQGDIVRSTTGEKLGDPDKTLEFIPLMIKNEWILQENVAGKYEFRSIEPRTAANEHSDWNFKQNGADWKRVKAINCYALLPADIDAELAEVAKFKKDGTIPDLNKTLLPVVISFRSTSFNAGKGVSTHFAKAKTMEKFGVKPWSYTLKLGCYTEKNDRGTFFCFSVAQGGPANKAHVEKATEWVNSLKVVNVLIDEKGEADEHLPTGSRTVDI